MKRLIVALVVMLFILSLQIIAQAQDCRNVQQNYVPACELAKKYNIPFETALSLQSLAIVEVAGEKCGFKFSNDFDNRKNGILTNSANRNVYNIFINGLKKEMRVDNQRCTEYYRTMGPYGSGIDGAGGSIRVYQ